MSFHDLISQGIEKIYNEDIKSQRHFIDTIARELRNMNPEIIYKAKGFVVPNEDYMLRFFGEQALNKDYDLYDYMGNCIWQEHLVLPIMDLANRIVGLVGYNFITRLRAQETGDWTKGYYKYSSKKVFDRGMYMYVLPAIYEKAINEGYIILADGVFDMLSTVQEGYNSAALLGSSLNQYIIAQLKFIPNIYLAMDNDEAGMRLLKELKRYLPQVRRLSQNKTKDIDEMFKTKDADKFKEIINNSLKNKTKLDLLLRF